MIDTRRRSSSCLATLLATCVLASACSGGGEVTTLGEGGGACSFTIEFDGAVYTDAADEQWRNERRGERLGTAALIGCPDDVDGPPDDELTTYAIVGTSPDEAVFAAPAGVMVRSDLDED